MNSLSAQLYVLNLARRLLAKARLGNGRPAENVCSLEPQSHKSGGLLLFCFDLSNHSLSIAVGAAALALGMDVALLSTPEDKDAALRTTSHRRTTAMQTGPDEGMWPCLQS